MANIILYRKKCIGCGICVQMQPDLWCMSRKDGKAVLLKSTEKKEVFVLPVCNSIQTQTFELARACPVKIIKLS